MICDAQLLNDDALPDKVNVPLKVIHCHFMKRP